MSSDNRLKYTASLHGLKSEELAKFGDIGRKLEGEIIDVPVPMTPRTEYAVQKEGLTSSDLEKKTIDDFSAAGLPRETQKVRQGVIEEEEKLDSLRGPGSLNVATTPIHLKSAGSLGEFSGALNALGSVMSSQPFEYDREKFGRQMAIEKKWLKKALQAELARCRDLMHNESFHQEEDNNHAQKLKEDAERRRLLAEKRRHEADMKAMMEAEERRRDREDARMNFKQRQIEQARRDEEARRRAKEQYSSQLDAEKQKAEFTQKQEQKRIEREIYMREAQLEKEEKDKLTKEFLERRKKEHQDQIRLKGEAKKQAIDRALSRDKQATLRKLNEYEEKCRRDDEKQARIDEERKRQAELHAVRQRKLEMKRRAAQDDAAANVEEMQLRARMRAIETEEKLTKMKSEKDVQLAAKKEFEYLKNASREFNLERMRRKDENRREELAEQMALKMARAKVLEEERKLLNEERRKTMDGSFKARLAVRDMIHDMKIKSKFNPSKIEKMLRALEQEEDLRSMFEPFDPSVKILTSVARAARPGMESPLPAHRLHVGGSPKRMPSREGGTSSLQRLPPMNEGGMQSTKSLPVLHK